MVARLIDAGLSDWLSIKLGCLSACSCLALPWFLPWSPGQGRLWNLRAAQDYWFGPTIVIISVADIGIVDSGLGADFKIATLVLSSLKQMYVCIYIWYPSLVVAAVRLMVSFGLLNVVIQDTPPDERHAEQSMEEASAPRLPLGDWRSRCTLPDRESCVTAVAECVPSLG